MTTGPRSAGGEPGNGLDARLAEIDARYPKPRSLTATIARAFARSRVRREHLLGRRAALWFDDTR